MKDPISEMQYGDSAIKVAGKFLMSPNGDIEINGIKAKRTLVLGAVVTPEYLPTEPSRINSSSKTKYPTVEMWECEVVIIPKRKYAYNKEHGFACMRADQMLCSAWGDRENWEKNIFSKSD